MANTNFTGPILSGDLQAGDPNGPNIAPVVLTQTVELVADGTLNQNATFYIPAGSQILDIIADVVVAFNSGTTSAVSVGTGPTSPRVYAGPADVRAVGREYFPFTNQQLAAMYNTNVSGAVIPTLPSVYVEVLSTGAAPTNGRVFVTMTYAQLTSTEGN